MPIGHAGNESAAKPLATRRAPMMSARWAALVAVGGGLAGALAVPTAGIWPLAVRSVAALSVAVDGRRARTGAWLGLLFGLALFVPLLHWTGVYVGPVPWLTLAVAEAVWQLQHGAVQVRVTVADPGGQTATLVVASANP